MERRKVEEMFTMSTYFEDRFRGYSCNFNLLEKLVNNKCEASDYYAWVRDTYKQYYATANEEQKGRFIIRYYKSKKLMYSSAQMLVEAKVAKRNECVVAYYYLIYYALFQAMQANLIICTAYDDEKVLQLSHENVKKFFDEQFCKTKKCPLDGDIVVQLEKLREYREYYSYAMPFNLSKDAVIDEDVLEEYIKICYQFLNLRLFIFSEEVSKSVKLDISCKDSVREYMYKSCNRIGDTNVFQDDADQNFWYELERYGGADILPITMAYDHDFDEYGTYDYEVYEKINMPRTQYIVREALSLIYSIL